MLNERDYFRQWQQVPRETSPPAIRERVIQKSGILNKPTMIRHAYPKRAYLCANLLMVLAIFLLVGFDLHRSDKQGQERLVTNTISLAQKASLSLQTAMFEKER